MHKERLPSAVDDAASVILESKRKEAFVRKNAPVDKDSSVGGLTIFVLAVLFWWLAERYSCEGFLSLSTCPESEVLFLGHW